MLKFLVGLCVGLTVVSLAVQIGFALYHAVRIFLAKKED